MTTQQLEKQQHIFIPKVDATETENAWIMLFDMPGVSKELVNVSVEKGVVKISGKTDKSKLKEDFEVLYSEYYTGNYERTLALPKDVDVSKIEATVKDGVLRLELPKTEKAKPIKIEVKSV